MSLFMPKQHNDFVSTSLSAHPPTSAKATPDHSRRVSVLVPYCVTADYYGDFYLQVEAVARAL